MNARLSANKILYLLLYCSVNIMFSHASYGQQRQQFNVGEEVVFATVDRPGELYLVLRSGKILRFDTEGKLQAEGSFPPPLLFEPRDGARLFIFSRSKQQYAYLKPSLTPYSEWQSADEAFAIDPFLVSTAGDHQLLILDSADVSLKKLNTKTNTLVFEVNVHEHVSSVKNISAIREYQNFIFLLDTVKGIHIFNSIGTYLRTIAAKRIRFFNFLGEELYYQEEGWLKFFNLFSADERQISQKHPYDFTLLTDERKYCIRGRNVEIFNVKQ